MKKNLKIEKIFIYIVLSLPALIIVLFFLIIDFEKPSLIKSYSKLENADLNSYQVLVDGYGWGYIKDKSRVFFYLGDGKQDYKLIEVNGANPKTFKVIYLEYGKDDNNVYHGWDKVDNADPDTFEVYYFPDWSLEYEYAKDKNSFYYQGKKIHVTNEQELIDKYFKYDEMKNFELVK